MSFDMTDVEALQAKLNGDNGIIAKITELADATDDGTKKQKIIALIGSIIDLIVTAIKGAFD